MPKKYPCPDCRRCLWCTDTRCSVCLGKSKSCQRKLSQAEQIALYESINRAHQQQKTKGRMKQRALFLCTDNSCLSPMAAALVSFDFGDCLEAVSAGLTTQSLNPQAIAVMAELGIDLGSQASNGLSHYEREPFDYVITLSVEAEKNCPLYFGGVRRHSMGFTDPSQTQGSAEEIMTDFRKTRDSLRQQLSEFFRQRMAHQ